MTDETMTSDGPAPADGAKADGVLADSTLVAGATGAGATGAGFPVAGVPATGEWRRAFGVLNALIAREMRVLARFPVNFLLRTVTNPLMFVFIFTYVYPHIGAGGFGTVGGRSLATVALPGLVASAIFFQGLNAVALPLAMEFGASREIEDRVMAPAPYAITALAKVLFSAIQSMIAAAIVFLLSLFIPATPVDLHISDWPLLITTTLLASLLAAFLGLLLGTIVHVRQIAVVFAITIIPLTFLGCVYYPWSSLHTIHWLQYLVLANPLVYVSEALRAALTPGLPTMPVPATLSALTAATIVLGYAAIRSFYRRVLS